MHIYYSIIIDSVVDNNEILCHDHVKRTYVSAHDDVKRTCVTAVHYQPLISVVPRGRYHVESI